LSFRLHFDEELGNDSSLLREVRGRIFVGEYLLLGLEVDFVGRLTVEDSLFVFAGVLHIILVVD
jgi:hypothetical protein